MASVDVLNIANLAAPWEEQTARVLRRPYEIHQMAFDAFKRNESVPALAAGYRNSYLKDSLQNDYTARNFGQIQTDMEAQAQFDRDQLDYKDDLLTLDQSILNDTSELQLQNAVSSEEDKARQLADRYLQAQAEKEWWKAYTEEPDVEGESPDEKVYRVARRLAGEDGYNSNRFLNERVYKELYRTTRKPYYDNDLMSNDAYPESDGITQGDGGGYFDPLSDQYLVF